MQGVEHHHPTMITPSGHGDRTIRRIQSVLVLLWCSRPLLLHICFALPPYWYSIPFPLLLSCCPPWSVGRPSGSSSYTVSGSSKDLSPHEGSSKIIFYISILRALPVLRSCNPYVESYCSWSFPPYSYARVYCSWIFCLCSYRSFMISSGSFYVSL